MPIITKDDLRHGDVLLCKSTGTVAHKVIGFGQWFFSGSKYTPYVHASIFVGEDTGTIFDGPKTGTSFTGPCQIESHAPGITLGPIYPPLTAFRLKSGVQGFKRLSLAAAEVAREFMGANQANDAFGKYAYAGAATSLFTRQGLDKSNKQYVYDLAQKKYSGTVFCSMLVVLCYQVAVVRMANQRATAPINVVPLNSIDAKAMQPAYLAEYLDTSPHWDNIGDWNGPPVY